MLLKWKYSRHLRSLHTSPVLATNLLARAHLLTFHQDLRAIHGAPEPLTPSPIKSYEAYTSLTQESLIERQCG